MSAGPHAVTLTLDFSGFVAAMNRAGRAIAALTKALARRPHLTDDETYALRLAVAHVRDGRTDLAAEDFLWLGRRLEAAA